MYRDKRRRLLAQIHIAKKEVGLDDETYREILDQETGKRSCACMTMPELTRIKRRFIACGWTPGAPPGGQVEALKRQVFQRAETFLGPTWRERLNGLCRALCEVDRIEWVRSTAKLKRLLAAIRKAGESETIYD